MTVSDVTDKLLTLAEGRPMYCVNILQNWGTCNTNDWCRQVTVETESSSTEGQH